MKKVCAIIPSYNEEKNILGVLGAVKAHGIDTIVIDDGSTDKTYELAKSNGSFLIRHDKKKGKGASLRDGLDCALSKGYDYILTIDADGQHSPDELAMFIKEADKDEEIGIVIGNRLNNPENMPFIRLKTNKFMSSLLSGLCKQNIPDTQCGYKLIKKEVLKVISVKSRKFEVESELLIKAARAGFKIRSIPIKSIYASEVSKINPFIDTLRFIRFLIKTIFTK